MKQYTSLAVLVALPTLALAQSSSAAAPAATNIGPSVSFGNTCPNGELNYSDAVLGNFCCPGTIGGSGTEQYCCVGANFEVPTPSFAACNPFCSGSTSNVVIQSTSAQSCQTKVPLTASDYSSLVSAAATASGSAGGASGSISSVAANATMAAGSSASGSDMSATASGSAAGADNTGSSSAATGSSSQGGSGAAGQDGEDSSASASASASNSDNAAPAITVAPVVGAFLAAGGLLMAL